MSGFEMENVLFVFFGRIEQKNQKAIDICTPFCYNNREVENGLHHFKEDLL